MHDRRRFPRTDVLLVGVDPRGEFREHTHQLLRAIEREEPIDELDTLWFESYDALYATFTPQTMELLKTIRTENPASIRETARLVDRNVSNVHSEVTRLARLGVIDLVAAGIAKQPVFRYARLLIEPTISSPTDRLADTVEA